MKGEKQSKGRTTNREEKIYLTWGGGGQHTNNFVQCVYDNGG